jgi:alpha-1,2-mannosyltransferase
LLGGLLGLVVVAAYAGRVRGGMVDFSVNYRAGQRLEAGETLYQRGDGHYMFKYLPVSALIYLPLSHLPIELAKATWFAMSLLVLAGSLALVLHLVPVPHRPYLLLLSVLVLAKYFLHELRLGQINILVSTLMLLATSALSKPAEPRHDAAAGALAGIATALKPYAAVFFPYFLLKRNWTAAAAGICVLAIALWVPAIFYGARGNIQVLREWATTLSQSTPGQLTNNDNVSVFAFFAKWFARPADALAASCLVLAVLALLMLAVIVRGRNARSSFALECAMLLTLVPLISPLGWDYTFLMSLLAVALLINAFEAFPKTARLILAVNFVIIAVAVFDIMGRRAYSAYMEWSVTTVNFLIVVAALAYLRFRAYL